MQRIGDWKRFIVFEDNKASLTHSLSTEMSQSYNAHPRPELVVNGGFRLNDILKVWSSYMSREDFEGLASNHEEEITRTGSTPGMLLSGATVRLAFCIVTQMSSSSY